ncbi:MAG: hemolysin D [Ferrovum sp. 37-45-19]|nr:MAG: hemolysin D [Ferrovum sp. 21-44-67]OYV95562.1 MAG: hemolysin D [Ferrovum sp. 37-45-19]HQT81876.1 efflux RND transporter periplasmic adaptor subunit [Ferrovaceae bacterium]HQU05816.1 efflux RND transporter periplasmic adaptor subunit [Ferrovaceae bacterium]
MLQVPKKIFVILTLLLCIALGILYWLQQSSHQHNQITLYGNVDIRQVQAAFYDTGRIVTILVQEGDNVKKGQLLAQLDPVRFQELIKQQQALLAAQQQLLNRLRNGSRPEEIEQARSEVSSAKANLINTQITYERQLELVKKQYVPKQNVDNALAAFITAKANLNHAQQTLKLALEGPRKEDIKAAEQQLKSYQSALALSQQELLDANLYAPESGVIENRILEPGDMVTPQAAVLTLALDNPIWVRAYIPETSLGLIHPGMPAEINSDSYPNQPFAGWIGYISPTAEFTPKNVETPELRTQLVYQVRIFACNTNHRLRLGMPITLHINLTDKLNSHLGNDPCSK